MPKTKLNLIWRARHLFTHHPWLKLISFLLAIVVWLYVRGEISRFNY